MGPPPFVTPLWRMGVDENFTWAARGVARSRGDSDGKKSSLGHGASPQITGNKLRPTLSQSTNSKGAAERMRISCRRSSRRPHQPAFLRAF
jgi:hypothetical protein